MPDYRQEARRAASRYGLDPHIFERQIGVESVNYAPDVISGRRSSPAGAQGIAQIMPGTAKGWGVNPLDPIAALNAAAKNMAKYVKDYGGYENALRAYNAGPGAIERSKGFAETNNYVSKILGGRRPTGLGSPSRSAGSQSSAPAASVAGAPSAATPSILAGGQASDFTSLLSSVIEHPQAPPSTALQAPQLSASLKLPQGFAGLAPSAAPATQQQDPVSDALGLAAALGGTGATIGSPDAPVAADGPIAKTVHGDRASGGGGAGAALAWAESKIGFKESGGENRGGLADYANSRFGMTGAAWCAMFTSLATTKGGAPKSARTASVAEVRRKALAGQGYQRGLVDPSSAQAGDLILFGDDHIGMVQGVENGKIRYVGGNQSDSVSEASVPVGKGDIVRPKYGARR